MQSKYKVVVGSLVGAVAIHATFVACGGSIRQGGDGSGGSDGGLFDAVVDVISDVVGGETRDAVAAVDAGNGNDGGTLGDDGGTVGNDGGACGCTVSLSGPVHTTPASDNSAQLKMGSFPYLNSTGVVVVNGPFILTDAVSSPNGGNEGATLAIQPTGSSCASVQTGLPGTFLTILTTTPVHGGRYLIPAGQMLCAYAPSLSSEGSLQWAGFVPYE